MKERKTGKTLVANEDTNFSTELLKQNEHREKVGIRIALQLDSNVRTITRELLTISRTTDLLLMLAAPRIEIERSRILSIERLGCCGGDENGVFNKKRTEKHV
jgi:hypothetical protein